MESISIKKYLSLIKYCTDVNILSLNSAGYLKDLVLRHDKDLIRIFDKYLESMDNSSSYSHDNDTEVILEDFLENCHELISRESETMFQAIYQHHSLDISKQASIIERKNSKSKKDLSLTYGEIEYKSFYRILCMVQSIDNSSTNETIFYDLGSGSGRAIIAATLTQNFQNAKGIEILSSLYDISKAVESIYLESYRHLLHQSTGSMEFILGSILDYDWSDGDIVFVNSTCFTDDLMNQVSQKANLLSPGAIVITFTNSLTSTWFDIINTTRYEMSWGPATVYIHRRRCGNPDVILSELVLDNWRSKCRQIDPRPRRTSKFIPNVYEHCETYDIQEIYPSLLKANRSTQCLYKFSEPVIQSHETTIHHLKFLLRAPNDWSSLTYTNQPLMIYLHGRNIRGKSLSVLRNFGLSKALEISNQLWPLIEGLVCCPLCPIEYQWKDEVMTIAVMDIVEVICQQFSVDRSRIYITGTTTYRLLVLAYEFVNINGSLSLAILAQGAVWEVSERGLLQRSIPTNLQQ